MCQEPRRNSPSVTSLRPSSACIATAFLMQSSSQPRRVSAVIQPFSCSARAAKSGSGRNRLPTWSARNGGPGGLLIATSSGQFAGWVEQSEPPSNTGWRPKFSPQRSSAGFPPARIDMAASKCVHDGRTEITNDESPRSPDKKRDQEKSEPKRDTAPYTWHRPEAAKRQDRKEQGDDRTQCSEKHRIPSANISSSYPRRRFGYGR